MLSCVPLQSSSPSWSLALTMPGPFGSPYHLPPSPSFYIVHHTPYIRSFLDAPSHTLDSCTTALRVHRTPSMAETTPLLPQANNPPHDHPIFLRVCHSPWLFLGQKSLIGVRGFLAIYMTTVLALDLVFEIVYAKRGRLLLFFISDLSYVIQIIYYWITFVSQLLGTTIGKVTSLT